jgi:hypothetical protein
MQQLLALGKMRTSAFISYSHEDSKWLKKLETMLAPLRKQGLKIWSDDNIKPGGLWKEDITAALADAKVAVLLVSPNFLASSFIHNMELPPLLNAAKAEGLTILWIPIEECFYEKTVIGDYQAAFNPKQPLASLSGARVNEALKEICTVIESAMDSGLEQTLPTSSFVSENVKLVSQLDDTHEMPLNKPAILETNLPGVTIISYGGSPYVVCTKEEDLCKKAISKPGNLVRIKSPDKMGKSKMMTRILKFAESNGYRTVKINLREEIDQSIIIDENSNLFLSWFCESIAEQLHISAVPDQNWSPNRSPVQNCSRYLEKIVLPDSPDPLLLAIDNFDCIFEHEFIMTDLLGLLRAWFEKANGSQQFEKLRQLIVYSQESYAIKDINQSPLNIGVSIEIGEFNAEQIIALAQAYGINSWSEKNTNELMAMIGGHPYLVQIALDTIANGQTLSELLSTAATEEGVFYQHLYEHLLHLEENADLYEAMKKVVSQAEPVRLDVKETFKLDGMGLIKRKGNNIVSRCNLYQLYLGDRMKP